MARGRKTKKKITKADIDKKIAPQKIQLAQKVQKQNIFKQLKLGESYVSLILGAVVVLALSLIFFVFIKDSSTKNISEVKLEGNLPTITKTQDKTYILQENETLWDVAVKFYGDGFRWPDIVEANKDVIDNPDYVPPGTRLTIPNAK